MAISHINNAFEHMFLIIMMLCKLVNGCLIRELKRKRMELGSLHPPMFLFCVRLKLPVTLIRRVLKILIKYYSKIIHYSTCKILISLFGLWTMIKLPVILKMVLKFLVKKKLIQTLILKRLNYIRIVTY